MLLQFRITLEDCFLIEEGGLMHCSIELRRICIQALKRCVFGLLARRCACWEAAA